MRLAARAKGGPLGRARAATGWGSGNFGLFLVCTESSSSSRLQKMGKWRHWRQVPNLSRQIQDDNLILFMDLKAWLKKKGPGILRSFATLHSRRCRNLTRQLVPARSRGASTLIW